MHPQFTAWQNASHARIACVSCHISEGAKGFAYAKLTGVRQLVHVITNSIPEPIPPGAGDAAGRAGGAVPRAATSRNVSPAIRSA